MIDQKLLQRLRRAYQCCDACGERYGTYRAGASSYWHGVCDVCGLEMAVTETRDWNYLHRGIAEVQELACP